MFKGSFFGCRRNGTSESPAGGTLGNEEGTARFKVSCSFQEQIQQCQMQKKKWALDGHRWTFVDSPLCNFALCCGYVCVPEKDFLLLQFAVNHLRLVEERGTLSSLGQPREK